MEQHAYVEQLHKNALLQVLDECDIASILVAGTIVSLTKGLIYDVDQPMKEAIFPIDSVLSVVVRMADGSGLDAVSIGREGTSALPLIFEGGASPNQYYCQIPGLAVQIHAEHFHRLRNSNDKFRDRLQRYLFGYVNSVTQISACNRLHTVTQRCVRWLLMTHDRVDRRELELTHEQVAMILGSRRSSVTLALERLKLAGYIRYNRGKIAILNPRGLERIACDCSAIIRQQLA